MIEFGPEVYLFALKMNDGRGTEEKLLQVAKEHSRVTGRPTFYEEEWGIACEEKGKPYFPHHPEVQFSVSHSGEWWICAIGTVQIGVDLQEHALLRNETKEQAIIRFHKMARRFFHPFETAYVEGETQGFKRFFRVWAARESYVKYTGQGIDHQFSEFCMIPEEPEMIDETLKTHAYADWKAQGVWMREIKFRKGYQLCICSEEKYGQSSLVEII